MFETAPIQDTRKSCHRAFSCRDPGRPRLSEETWSLVSI